jgi:hypothetical protein
VPWAALTALVVSAGAQTAERRATFNGRGGDNGKCTIEVEVDGVVDVEIRGDRGVLRTLSGQRGLWRRFECNAPLPANPGNFRFSGIDGRGSQILLQDPNSGRGAAIVRIQDPKGGAEGYTFDLEWRGGTSDDGPPLRPPLGGRDLGRGGRNSIPACEEAVRGRALQRYGTRNVEFGHVDLDNNPGPDDSVVGSFDVPRGAARGTYRFTCSVNLATGRVRAVDIVEARGGPPSGRRGGPPGGRMDIGAAISLCQGAVEDRLRRDGYRNSRIASVKADDRPGRSDWILGTLSAQQSQGGRTYNMDFACSIDFSTGDIRSVDVNRQ